MIYVTSDLHGFPLKDFRKLLDQAKFSEDDFLFVLGDVMDRNGDGGVEMLRWMMLQPNVVLLKGNHEAMMLACDFIFEEVTDDLLDRLDEDKIIDLQTWLYNGAEPTVDSLMKLHKKQPETFYNLLAYVHEAPLYETVSLPIGDYLLTHAGLGNFAENKPLSAYNAHDFLWHRPSVNEKYFSNVTTVFGHTPVWYYGREDGRMLRTETWIDIDTGASGGGKPMLLRLDDLKEFYCG